MQARLQEAAVAIRAGRREISRRVILPDRAPYPARLRVILILSMLSWIMVALVLAWAIKS